MVDYIVKNVAECLLKLSIVYNWKCKNYQSSGVSTIQWLLKY